MVINSSLLCCRLWVVLRCSGVSCFAVASLLMVDLMACIW